METVKIEIKSSKAMKLLKDLENQDIIKIHKSDEKQDKASKYRGSISPKSADQLLRHLEKSRNEWDERFPTK
ncbi:MAG: hypothetical protein ABI359_05735 [Ginsengibacter sp.]